MSQSAPEVQSPHPKMRDEEGRTPAAWTTVYIMLIAFCVGTFAVCIEAWWLFWVGGVGLLIVGAIVGKVMAAMGMGQYQKETPGQKQDDEA